MKLLIVDDSDLMRRAIRRSLADGNHEIATACDGLEALRMIETFSPDAVTMDLSMPNMDGLTCIERMLRARPGTRILVVSSLKDRPTAVEAIKRGAQGFLLKPFSAETLTLELRELLSP